MVNQRNKVDQRGNNIGDDILIESDMFHRLRIALDAQDKAQIMSVLKEMERYDELDSKNIADSVKDYVLTTDGYFSTTDVYRDLHIATNRAAKRAAYQSLFRLVRDGVLEKHGSISGRFRKLDVVCDKMDWENAPDTGLDIQLPLGIHDLSHIYPGTLVLISGEKDSSKTGFALETARLNMGKMKIKYFNVEMGETELKGRLLRYRDVLGIPLEDWSKHVDFRNRGGDFAPVLDPDAINIIDYLNMTEEVYRMGTEMEKIHARMINHGGVCIVGTQRSKGKEWGKGGQPMWEKPRLIVNLYEGRIGNTEADTRPFRAKIKSCKMRKGHSDPKGMECEFLIYSGCEFSITKGWEYKDEEEPQYSPYRRF